MHILDAACMYRALEDPPRKTQADIARETGKSPAYVSTLCRIGDAIRDLPRDELDGLRQPHLTYTALATLVARHKRPAALLAAMRALVDHPPRRRSRATTGGASLWTRAEPRNPAMDPIDPVPMPYGFEEPVVRQTFTYAFNPASWRADPETALDAFEAHLRELLDGVMRQAKMALGGAGGPLSLTPSPPLPSRQPRAERAATLASLEVSLRQLEARVEATRRGHRAQIAAFDAERAARREAQARAKPIAVSPEELAADLGE